jgi:hypothetical protein
MSMQHGRGGMGVHKHGVSGHGGKPPKAKMRAMLQANKQLDEQEKIRAQKKQRMCGSIPELMKTEAK